MSDAVERHLQVVRTARYWVIGEDVSNPAEVWFVLHGYKQLARRFLRRFEPLADGTRLLVAPEGLSRFYADESPGRHGPGAVVGATWMTREDREHEIADYVCYLDALADRVLGASGSGGAPGAARPRVTVLGFSQGVATAARWTTLGRTRPDRLVLWGDLLPTDLDLSAAREAWRTTQVILARGRGDRVFTDPSAAEQEELRIRDAGIAARRVGFDGGHDIHQPTLQALAAEA